MTTLRFLLILTFLSSAALAQPRQRTVTDNGKKFNYSDSAGVTQSYIKYFGEVLPVPDLQTIDGKPLTPASKSNKVVVYNCWFVACRPCVAEIPALNQLATKYQSDSALFIAITFDTENRIRTFLQKNPFAFQIASLPQKEIDAIKKVALYPFTAIVNKKGKLSFVLFGRPAGENMEDLFSLLDQQVRKALDDPD